MTSSLRRLWADSGRRIPMGVSTLNGRPNLVLKLGGGVWEVGYRENREHSSGKNKWRLGDSNAQDKAITLDFVILAWPLESQDLEKFQKTKIIYYMINTDPW